MTILLIIYFHIFIYFYYHFQNSLKYMQNIKKIKITCDWYYEEQLKELITHFETLDKKDNYEVTL